MEKPQSAHGSPMRKRRNAAVRDKSNRQRLARMPTNARGHSQLAQPSSIFITETMNTAFAPASAGPTAGYFAHSFDPPTPTKQPATPRSEQPGKKKKIRIFEPAKSRSTSAPIVSSPLPQLTPKKASKLLGVHFGSNQAERPRDAKEKKAGDANDKLSEINSSDDLRSLGFADSQKESDVGRKVAGAVEDGEEEGQQVMPSLKKSFSQYFSSLTTEKSPTDTSVSQDPDKVVHPILKKSLSTPELIHPKVVPTKQARFRDEDLEYEAQKVLSRRNKAIRMLDIFSTRSKRSTKHEQNGTSPLLSNSKSPPPNDQTLTAAPFKIDRVRGSASKCSVQHEREGMVDTIGTSALWERSNSSPCLDARSEAGIRGASFDLHSDPSAVLDISRPRRVKQFEKIVPKITPVTQDPLLEGDMVLNEDDSEPNMPLLSNHPKQEITHSTLSLPLLCSYTERSLHRSRFELAEAELSPVKEDKGGEQNEEDEGEHEQGMQLQSLGPGGNQQQYPIIVQTEGPLYLMQHRPGIAHSRSPVPNMACQSGTVEAQSPLQQMEHNLLDKTIQQMNLAAVASRSSMEHPQNRSVKTQGPLQQAENHLSDKVEIQMQLDAESRKLDKTDYEKKKMDALCHEMRKTHEEFKKRWGASDARDILWADAAYELGSDNDGENNDFISISSSVDIEGESTVQDSQLVRLTRLPSSALHEIDIGSKKSIFAGIADSNDTARKVNSIYAFISNDQGTSMSYRGSKADISREIKPIYTFKSHKQGTPMNHGDRTIDTSHGVEPIYTTKSADNHILLGIKSKDVKQPLFDLNERSQGGLLTHRGDTINSIYAFESNHRGRATHAGSQKFSSYSSASRNDGLDGQSQQGKRSSSSKKSDMNLPSYTTNFTGDSHAQFAKYLKPNLPRNESLLKVQDWVEKYNTASVEQRPTSERFDDDLLRDRATPPAPLPKDDNPRIQRKYLLKHFLAENGQVFHRRDLGRTPKEIAVGDLAVHPYLGKQLGIQQRVHMPMRCKGACCTSEAMGNVWECPVATCNTVFCRSCAMLMEEEWKKNTPEAPRYYIKE